MWYPLRRSGTFAQLPDEEQRAILAEHGAIGMTFGAATTRTTSGWPAMASTATTTTSSSA